MTALVYNRPASKARAAITCELEALVLEQVRHISQQKLSRQLGISQSAISRIVRKAGVLEALEDGFTFTEARTT